MKDKNTILIVDDNPTNLDILREILEDQYELISATSGEEAQEKAQDYRPSLILLDIMMPGIDGYETCKRIRTNPNLKYTKIVMLSAKAMISERLEGYDSGADDYITKPFVEDELMAKVRVYIKLKSIEEVDQLKTQLFTLLRHATFTPMNGIIGSLETLLSDDIMESNERNSWLNDIYKTSIQLNELLDKVYTLSQLQFRGNKFSREKADLSEIVNLVINQSLKQAEQAHITIKSNICEHAMVMADIDHVEGAVRSVLENAIKFSREDGHVQVVLSQDDDYFSIKISDDGEGVDSKYLTDVFDVFSNEDVSHHNRGLGLNLAIARQVIQEHNGSMSVASQKDKGSLFTLRIPVFNE